MNEGNNIGSTENKGQSTQQRFLRWRYQDAPAQVVWGDRWEGVQVEQGEIAGFIGRIGEQQLFFHVHDLNQTWNNPSSHRKGKVTSAAGHHVQGSWFVPFDFDSNKFGTAEATASEVSEAFYREERTRITGRLRERFEALGLQPHALWLSGPAGQQGLFRMTRLLSPNEAKALTIKLAGYLGSDGSVHNPNRVLRVAGSMNRKTNNGRRMCHTELLRLEHGAVSPEDLDAALNAVSLETPAAASANRPHGEGIDWTKAESCSGWLRSEHDLPKDFPLKGRIIIGHYGTLHDLNESLVEAGLKLAKAYSSWSDVHFALASLFKSYGKLPIEQVAAALRCDLPCNQHLRKFRGDEAKIRRAIERALQRSSANQSQSSGTSGWPDGSDDHNVPYNTYANTKAAIQKLDIVCFYDEFRNKQYTAGHDVPRLDGHISDFAISRLRDRIDSKFGFYPSKDTTIEAMTNLCLLGSRNPVVEWLNSLIWDSRPRLDKMLHVYLGADDTVLNAAIGRKLLCAMVRRAKRPGCKWDHMPIVEGPQGIRKSMWTKDLAGERDLHTDTSILISSSKEQMEIMGPKWVIEVGELAGFRESGRARLKRFLTADSDTARMAYDRFAVDQLRSSVLVGTSNPERYLSDPSGERRYWPFEARWYDRESFLRDRAQLFAEAVACEPTEELWLNTPELVAAHDDIVAARKEPNELVEILSELKGEVFATGEFERIDGVLHRKMEMRVSNAAVRAFLGIQSIDAIRNSKTGVTVADAMANLGWRKAKDTMVCSRETGAKPQRGYRKAVAPIAQPAEQQPLNFTTGDLQPGSLVH